MLRPVRRRFGATITEYAAPLLQQTTTLEILEALGEAVLDYEKGNDWLARLKKTVAELT